MFYTYSQYLITLNIVVTSLSLLSSFTMSLFCFKSPVRHTVCLKLILGIALADFFYSISNVFSFFDNSTEAICVIESILRLCSYQFSLIFATSIAILCYKASTPHFIFDQRGFFKAIIALCCTSLAILILL